MEEAPLLTTKEAAQILSLSTGTIENWRFSGLGPPFIKLPTGPIRYRKDELLAWVEQGRRTA